MFKKILPFAVVGLLGYGIYYYATKGKAKVVSGSAGSSLPILITENAPARPKKEEATSGIPSINIEAPTIAFPDDSVETKKSSYSNGSERGYRGTTTRRSIEAKKEMKRIESELTPLERFRQQSITTEHITPFGMTKKQHISGISYINPFTQQSIW